MSQRDDDGSDAQEENTAAETGAPSEAAPPMLEYLLVTGETARPGRVVLGAEPVETTIEFDVPL